MKEPIKLVFDSFMLESYLAWYFKRYPTRKANPLSWTGKTQTGMITSLNLFLNCPNRVMQNQRKQSFGDYAEFVVTYNGYNDLQIEQCVIVINQCKGDLRKFDVDNVMTKIIFDSFVKSGLLVEDNYTVVRDVVLTGCYDKSHPRTEVLIYQIDEQNTYEQVLDEVSKKLKINK